MSAKEKAEELILIIIEKAYGFLDDWTNRIKAKEIARIVVDEIIKETLAEYNNDKNHDRVEFLKKVKKELE